MWWFRTKERRELQELRLKSHYVSSLKAYLFFSYDIFHKTSQRYPSFELSKMATIGEDTVSTSLDLIHSAMVQYAEVAALSGIKVKVVDRVELNKWIYLHVDEYQEAIAHITKIVTAIAKKKEVTVKEKQ